MTDHEIEPAQSLTVISVFGHPESPWPHYRQECRICGWVGPALAGHPWRNAERQCPKCQPSLFGEQP